MDDELSVFHLPGIFIPAIHDPPRQILAVEDRHEAIAPRWYCRCRLREECRWEARLLGRGELTPDSHDLPTAARQRKAVRREPQALAPFAQLDFVCARC